MNTRSVRALSAALLLVLPLAVSGCGGDPYDDYCQTVDEKRKELSKILSEDDNSAFITALPILRDLRDQAPDDIRSSWSSIIDAAEGLQQVLEKAGVDPDHYDPKHPPPEVSKSERAEIIEAAGRLNSRTTARAATDVQQEVKDVCGKPLTY